MGCPYLLELILTGKFAHLHNRRDPRSYKHDPSESLDSSCIYNEDTKTPKCHDAEIQDGKNQPETSKGNVGGDIDVKNQPETSKYSKSNPNGNVGVDIDSKNQPETSKCSKPNVQGDTVIDDEACTSIAVSDITSSTNSTMANLRSDIKTTCVKTNGEHLSRIEENKPIAGGNSEKSIPDVSKQNNAKNLQLQAQKIEVVKAGPSTSKPEEKSTSSKDDSKGKVKLDKNPCHEVKGSHKDESRLLRDCLSPNDHVFVSPACLDANVMVPVSLPVMDRWISRCMHVKLSPLHLACWRCDGASIKVITGCLFVCFCFCFFFCWLVVCFLSLLFRSFFFFLFFFHIIATKAEDLKKKKNLLCFCLSMQYMCWSQS